MPTGKPYSLAETNHFTLCSHVYVYGGFAGTETDVGQRQTDATEKTILSGVLPESTGNAYLVLYIPVDAGITDAELHDVTILGGDASGSDKKGGALFLGSDATTYVASSRCSVLFDRVVFANNSSGGMGGAVYINDTEGVLFENCLFSRNSAVTGGNANTLENCAPGSTTPINSWIRFSGCGFLDNASEAVEGMSASGGGGAVHLHASKALFDYCTFMDNQTNGDGGAVALRNGGTDDPSPILVIANSFPNEARVAEQSLLDRYRESAGNVG